MSSLLQLPSRLHYGPGSLEKVKDIVKRDGVRKVMIFTDKSLRKLNMTAQLETYLGEAGASCHVIDNIMPEPSIQSIEETLSCVPDASADLLVAVGGGSVMDAAKLVSVLLGAAYSVRDLLQNPGLARRKLKTLMIPTTCGTGSEATNIAVVAIPEEQTKKGIVNSEMIPDEVILDVNLIAKLPKQIIASTGVDALAHCVECYTSKKATPLSDLYAAAGAKLIFHNIETAYSKPENLAARQELLLGAFYGGVALSNSGTTAVHALAYPLGGRYHIAHGVSNAMLLAAVMAFNTDACADRLALLCESVYPEYCGKKKDEKVDTVIRRITEIVKNTEIPVSLKDVGLKEEDLEYLVTAASQQTRLLVNNMKELSLSDIRNIYRQVM